MGSSFQLRASQRALFGVRAFVQDGVTVFAALTAANSLVQGLSIVTLLVLSINSVFAQGTLALSSGIVANSGATLNLTLTSPAGSEPAALQWTLTYSPTNVVSISAIAGASANAAAKSLNCSASSGSYICVLAGLNTTVVQNGVVAVVSVTIGSGVASATINVTNTLGASAEGNPLPINGIGGNVTTVPPPPLTPGTLALSSGTAANGSATLNLTLTSPTGSEPAALQWTLTYSPTNVVSISAIAGASANAAAKLLNCSASSGSYICVLAGLNTTAMQNGVVAVVSVTMGSGVASTTINVTNTLGASAGGNPLPINGAGGTVTAVASPTILSVVNAASYIGGSLSPGEMVTIFGAGIGPATPAYATTDPATGRLATTMGGVQVMFNGIAAPMIYASSTQVSAVVPYEMAPVATPSVWIKYVGLTSNAYQLNSAPTVPGLFTQDSSGSGPGAILNQDNSVNGPGNPAAKGSIVQVYLTGEGQTSPQGVTGAITTVTLPPPQVTPAPLLPIGVTINGQPALYVYAGEAPGLVAGVMQLNVQIPANTWSGPLPITVSIGGNFSQNGVTVSVQ